jgi:hypothetical protein
MLRVAEMQNGAPGVGSFGVVGLVLIVRSVVNLAGNAVTSAAVSTTPSSTILPAAALVIDRSPSSNHR